MTMFRHKFLYSRHSHKSHTITQKKKMYSNNLEARAADVRNIRKEGKGATHLDYLRALSTQIIVK